MVRLSVPEHRKVSLTVNGHTFTRAVPVRKLLVDFLRDDLGLTGTHIGCEHGACGACTILYEGEAIRSCLMLAVQADEARIETVEGLADAEALHPLQQAFRESHALQCGFCTPGMLMSAVAILREHRSLEIDQVRELLAGNLCRCTGYEGIVQAVMRAARANRS